VKVELHCHSTASDGTLTPEELVERALHEGLEALAITDHDTVAAYGPAQRAAAGYRLEVVPAVEINCEEGPLDVHILGYGLDPTSPPLLRTLASLQRSRVRRMGKILIRLRGLGVPVREERVLAFAGGQSVGRPHVARAMVEAGHVADLAAAFDFFLGQGKPAFVPRRNLRPLQAIQLVQEAGGVAVLAHPGQIGDESLIRALATAGLRGLEAFHPSHPPLLCQHYQELAGSLGLLVTGGSDYHGPNQRHRVDLGGVWLPPETYPRLRHAAGRGAWGSA
jgi:predicted metal-dependent phosphoesterase TrpH